MTDYDHIETSMNKLREKAREKVRSKFPSLSHVDSLTLNDIQELLHELEVRAVELEMQNVQLNRSQTALEKARDRYFQLYNDAPVGYVTLDVKQVVTNINERACKLLNVDSIDVHGEKFTRFVTKECLRDFEFHFRDAQMGGQTATIEIVLNDSYGAQFHARLESTCETMDDSDKDHIYLTITDISEIKRAEEVIRQAHDQLEDKVRARTNELNQMNMQLKAQIEETTQAKEELEESEARLKGIFESTSDIMIIKDKDLKITHVNSALANLHGKPLDHFIGKRVEEVLSPEMSKQFDIPDQKALQGEIVEAERSIIIDGNARIFLETRVPYMDAKGSVIGVCVLARDITDWKTANAKKVFPDIEFPSQAMQDVLSKAALAAKKDGTILLQGESGSGKDWLAKWIHDHSPRRNNPYFSVNCASLPPELAEAELFGYESGAFTGARARKKGLVELAEGGTLLLNEIGELSLQMQAKLLAFLDEMSFMRVGGEKMIKVDARLLAATHKDVEEEVEKGTFLAPLMYRLNVLTLRLPPLRERLDDLPILVRQILSDMVEKMRPSNAPEIDEVSIESLRHYHWPGNVRELRNTIERALMLEDGPKLSLRPPLPASAEEAVISNIFTAVEEIDLKEAKNQLTEIMCRQALERCKGNKKKAAIVLGISRDALYRYIKQYNIPV